VSWVTEGWRLKLLALGLSVLMLGAVAFAQNPPTFRNLTVNIGYTSPPNFNLIVLNAPTRTTVRITGLADAIQALTAGNVAATIDLSKATPGPAVKVNMLVKAPPGFTIENQIVPVVLNIDQLKQVTLKVQVRAPLVTEGWQVTKADAKCATTPCTVNFTGPASWETDAQGQTNLKAYADITTPVSGDSTKYGNITVDLEQNGISLDPTTFTKTVPNASLDTTSVEVDIEAKTSTTSKQVVLIDAQPSHGVPAGYQVTGVSIFPLLVLISGKADVVAKVKSITLPAVDLSGHTSDVTFTVTVGYPAGVSGSVQTARVTYSIRPNPAVQASPTPTG
jgi:YbbR domain-containing protein